jgi:single-stranded-DNA-specific exonuclease
MPNPEETAALAAAINVSEPLAALLEQRGVANFDQAKDFFRPTLAQLHDPFLMRDMDVAVQRLNEAISNREKIMVYGDYDVDGTTAVALVYGFLKQYHHHLAYYTPDRYAEGYGISMQGVDWAAQNDVRLIISLDCGIKAHRPILHAKNLGIDFIVCDHHRPGDTLPEAAAVLDPKRDDCPYPYKELSGCGVGFKLLHAFSLSNNIPEHHLLNYLDLVAVSIAADIVPITGENRVLAFFGLQKLNNNPSPGLKALADLADLRGEVEVTNIVFGIAPRINAVGRVAHASHAIKLLLAEQPAEAVSLAAVANSNNEERRGHDNNITAEALQMIEAEADEPLRRSTVLFKNDWHKGVIGIVAARCIERFYRPTVILTQSHDKATGSARSVAGFDIYEAIAECADLLDQYGGHMYAAGLTLPLDKVEAFQHRFEQVVAQQIRTEHLTPQIDVDLELGFDQINFKFFNVMQQMAPFGPQNMQPVFTSRRVMSEGQPRVLKDIHLKMGLRQLGENGHLGVGFDAIGFNLAHFYPLVAQGKPFDICYTINENEYKGRKNLQLVLKDIKPSA